MIHAYVRTFTQHYAMALLWADTFVEAAEPDSDEPRQAEHYWWQSPSDYWAVEAFDASGRKLIEEDCRAFVASNWRDLRDLDPEQAGHDFLLTRNGHGAGFWDRGLGERGERLAAACRPYGSVSAWCYPEYDLRDDTHAHLS